MVQLLLFFHFVFVKQIMVTKSKPASNSFQYKKATNKNQTIQLIDGSAR